MALSSQEKSDILELVARYNFAIDHRCAEDWADTFTDDGIFRIDKVVRAQGREALIAHVRKRMVEGALVRHWTNNAIIDGEGDRARLRIYLAVYDITRGPDAPYMFAEYDDQLVKIDGCWKFKVRDITVAAGRSTPVPA